MHGFGTLAELTVDDTTFTIHSLAGLQLTDLPYCLRILLESLLRHEDGERVTPEQIEALLRWGEGADH